MSLIEKIARNSQSESFKRRNPHLFGTSPKVESSRKRIRQEKEPKLNQLETEWWNIIKDRQTDFPRPRPQAKRYRIANGAWYKPDFTASSWPQQDGSAVETAWEVKGPEKGKNVARGKLALKCAATMWPEVAFYLVWKDAGQWQIQRILP